MKTLTIKEASNWATRVLDRQITESNINYLIQYGRIERIIDNGEVKLSLHELESYYKVRSENRREIWSSNNLSDINWDLSFQNYSESQTTKHVHRLHPYKGKFIPQLVEYFLDGHTDKHKKEVFFKKGDIVLDPFCGSGTTLVQANELGINAVGVDVSKFNAMISNCKVGKHDIKKLQAQIHQISQLLIEDKRVVTFDEKLKEELLLFNQKFFPSPQFKKEVISNKINEKQYGKEKEESFLKIYEQLAQKNGFDFAIQENGTFIERWFFKTIRNEITTIKNFILNEQDEDVREVLMIILSRTMRSCRATTHADLATLLKPVATTYYCSKHKKICKPLFSLKKWWIKYSLDTIDRLRIFDYLRTDTIQKCFVGDSRNINIEDKIKTTNDALFDKYKQQKIKGIFTSPPYVGVIDYHEQHAYAYDAFELQRNDDSEIGSLYKGSGRVARDSYIEGISTVLRNCKQYLGDDFEVFLVANDKFNLYPIIAEKAGLRIVEKHNRPVLNRTEKDKGAYSETIFRLKEK